MSTNPPDDDPRDSSGQPADYPPPVDPAGPPPGYASPPGYAAPPPGYGPQPGYYAPPPGYQAPPPGYPPPPGYAGPYGAPPPISDADQRTWAMLAHLSGFLSIIATIVIWAVYKDRGAYIKDQSAEALNFQIFGAIVALGMTIIAVVTLGFGSIVFLGLLVWPIFMILAAVATNRGEPYRYPFNWRLIR